MKKANGKTNSKSNFKMYRGILIAFFIVCLLFVGFSSLYYQNLHTTIREESKGYLQELSLKTSSNIDRIIKDNYGILYTMASGLESMYSLSPSDIQAALLKQQEHWNYASLYLIDQEGAVYDLKNKKQFIDIDNTMSSNILNKQQTMSTTLMVNNKEYILFSVPLNDLRVNGKTMIALAASYAPSSFDQTLSMTSFDQQAYSQIVTKSGTRITNPNSEDSINTGYNIFSFLENAALDRGYSLAMLKEDVQNNQSDQVSFTVEDSHWYLVYTPVNSENWYLLTFVPFQAVNKKSDILLNSTLVICALISGVFTLLMALLINMFRTHRNKLEQIAYIDPVTNGHTIQRFCELAEEILKNSSPNQFALVYSNIEKFKVLNEQLGRKNCDLILHHFYQYISSSLSENECMGRISADNFCLLLKYSDGQDLLSRFSCWHKEAEKYVAKGQFTWSLPVIEFGIYVIENYTLDFPQMIDRAKLALRESTRSINNKIHYSFYDDQVRRQLFLDKHLEDMMENALKNNEFQVYLQPKYHLPEERIGGAEALVRWESSVDGMIYPNDFIPLFEKNGFIVRLDLWVFEEVCRTIQSWMKRGFLPLKISVNCSRVHFQNPDFLKPYIIIASKYTIPKNKIEIELTENIVFENSDRLTKIIQEIRDAGFGCSMDDFGSGYSSLNLIQTIPVDTLKIDRIFFGNTSSETQRTEAVVASIVTMAKSLSMETVAEGIECIEQKDMLKRVGCDYIQGYVFARPMKIIDFEELAYGVRPE